MRKRSVVLLFSIAAIVKTIAAPVDSIVALVQALTFLRTTQPATRTLASDDVRPFAAGRAAYGFAATDGRFVLVAADDRLPDVLGYGRTGDTLPPALDGLLRLYERQLAAPPAARAAEARTTRPVAPLLRSVRHQRDPFNRSCPYYIDDAGQPSATRCVVGCVATALEQVLTYYRQPAALADTVFAHSSTHFTTTDVAPGTPIDWPHILDVYAEGQYSDAEARAVADLSLWCGQMAQMDWGTRESGAYVNRLAAPVSRSLGYGYVHYADGTLLGEREGDEPQFDPGVLTEGENTYLYTGFCFAGDKSRHGPMCTVLGPDMLTIRQEPVFIAPSQPYSQGSGFEGHEFFEAPSIRKAGDTYYFIYSSVVFHELCYATSKSPTQGFQYGGVIISNNDLGIGTYKPADKPMYYGGNNHGSMVQIGEKWYIFYHRQTNGTSFSRQAMAQEIQIIPYCSNPHVEITTCGLNGGHLVCKGTYPAHIACNLFCDWESTYSGGIAGNEYWVDVHCPRVTQDGRDGDQEPGYILNMIHSATAGYKYFDCQGVTKVTLRVRGYCSGAFQIKTRWDGPVLGEIPVRFTNVWKDYSTQVDLPDGVNALYFTYVGPGSAALLSFTLE